MESETEKKAAFTPKLRAVNCERGDLWRGEWRRCTVVACVRPRFGLPMVSKQALTQREDNMAATDRNLLLKLRIKATEPDRNSLSNTHTVDANRKKCEPLLALSFTLTHCCCCMPLILQMQILIKKSNEA